MESSLFYEGMSKIYDLLDVIYFKNNDANPRKALYDYINQQDRKILDICTGTAANAIAVANLKRDAEIIGIDISKEMLNIAAKKVKKNGIDNIKLYQMDATDTKFKSKTFDTVLISLVLHEIPEELAEKILLEAKRVLKPEERLLVIEWEEPQNLLKRILFYLIRKLEPKGFEQFLKIETKGYFEKYGLQILEIKHCDYTKVINLKKVTLE